MASKDNNGIVDGGSPEGSADQKECFVIMPISDAEGYPKGHFREVYTELIKPSVEAAGYNCFRADDVATSNMIHIDVVTRVVSADFCVCDLSSRNPNVLFEYGIRQAFDKPTVLLKDDRTDRIFDVSGFRDIEYDHTLRIRSTLATREKITEAIKSTESAKSDEVFSLVKLIGLSKAAKIPSENINREDAQFKLLNNKVQALTDIIQSFFGNSKWADVVIDRNIRRHVFNGPKSDGEIESFIDRETGSTIVLLPDGSARVGFKNGRVVKFESFEEVKPLKDLANLSIESIDRIRRHVRPF